MQQDLTIVEAVNRTTKTLNFMFDGFPGVVFPGYKKNAEGEIVPAGRDGQPLTTPLNKTMAEYARRQNVKLGTEDRYSGEAEFLVGIGERDENGKLTAHPHWMLNDISYTEQGESVERLNRQSMSPQDQNAVESPTSGFPRGRAGSAVAPFQYNEGPVDTSR
jgi:hypothetical protein